MRNSNPNHGSMSVMRRDGVVAAAPDAPAGNRTFKVTWTTGAKVDRRRWDWLNDRIVEFTEELDLSDGAVNMERLSSGRAPVLDAHAGWSNATTIGVVESATIEDATIRISDAPEHAGILRKIQDGISRNISVGYSVEQWEIIKEEGKKDRWIARKWTPYELSVVPIGADPDAYIRARELSLETRDAGGCSPFGCDFIYRGAVPEPQRKETPMTEENRGSDVNPEPKPTSPVAPAPAANDEAIRSAVETERKRIGDIRDAVRDFGFDDKDADEFIRSGKSIDEVRAELQKKLAARSAQDRQLPHVRGGTQNEFETRRNLVSNAIAHRARPGEIKLEDGARRYRGLTLLELAREVLSEEGVNVRGLDRMELAGLAVGLQRAAGMHSTSDFPLILANVAQKRLREVYEKAMSRWKLFCRQSNATDFKAKYITQLSEAPRMLRVPEHGEYTYGKLSETGVNYALSTYGRIIAITRQAIINDDLSAFDRLPTIMGQSAADNEADIVWSIITANPTMQDGTALFHANHGNLAASGGAISVATLGAGRAAMRVQKNIGNAEFLNLQASYLLIPAALETVAEQFIAQNLIPAQSSNVVPEWVRSLEPIVEPRLDANSTTAWYLAASPSRIDTIEYAYLEGQEGVYTEMRMGFEVDGIELKARHDFAAKAIDWRGLYRNAGA